MHETTETASEYVARLSGWAALVLVIAGSLAWLLTLTPLERSLPDQIAGILVGSGIAMGTVWLVASSATTDHRRPEKVRAAAAVLGLQYLEDGPADLPIRQYPRLLPGRARHVTRGGHGGRRFFVCLLSYESSDGTEWLWGALVELPREVPAFGVAVSEGRLEGCADWPPAASDERRWWGSRPAPVHPAAVELLKDDALRRWLEGSPTSHLHTWDAWLACNGPQEDPRRIQDQMRAMAELSRGLIDRLPS